MKSRETAGPEALLRSQERWCMNACNRYLNRDPSNDHVWILRDRTGETNAVIVHVKQNLMPVLCGQQEIPDPRFLCGLFGPAPIHALQGIQRDAIMLENALQRIGLRAEEKIDYDIMCIDRMPEENYCHSGPRELIIRRPEFTDMDALAALQAAYEQEEVLPAKSTFNAAVSRMNIERIVAGEHILAAELGGRLVGKINTSASTFTRFQIGGVFVHPDFRGLGIARRMATEFTRSLIGEGKGISLFVKKINFAARRVYGSLGFALYGDYRISYY